MKSRRLPLAAVLATAIVLSFFLIPIHSVTQAVGENIYLDLQTPASPNARGVTGVAIGDVPPPGSHWHELWPNYCGDWTQEDYRDNGDGVISACDIIVLDGMEYHITWAGPTYFTTCTDPTGLTQEVIYEPTADPNPQSPVCEIWHEVYPNFCAETHVDDYQDNGDGVLSECDLVYSGGTDGIVREYHIDRIGCNIIVEPGSSVPNKQTTWGLLKNLFKS